MNNHSW